MTPNPGGRRVGYRGRGGEASGFLVVPTVFNTDEVEYLGLAGSIPVRLRHSRAPDVAE